MQQLAGMGLGMEQESSRKPQEALEMALWGLWLIVVSSHHRMASDRLDHPDHIRHRLDGHAGYMSLALVMVMVMALLVLLASLYDCQSDRR